LRSGRRRAATACLAVLWWPHGAAAESGKVDEVIQELFLGRIVYPQDALELQVTAALGGSRAAGATGALAGLEVELGLTDRLQIAAEVPFAWTSTSTERRVGVGNASLGAMYNPLSDRALGLAVSAGLELAFPAPSRVGADAWSVEAFAVAYKVLGRVHLNLKGGVELELPDGEAREFSPASALGVFAPIGRWVPLLELRAEPRADPAAVVSAGALWHPAGELELGAAVQIGLDARSIGGLVIATVELELAAPRRRAAE